MYDVKMIQCKQVARWQFIAMQGTYNTDSYNITNFEQVGAAVTG